MVIIKNLPAFIQLFPLTSKWHTPTTVQLAKPCDFFPKRRDSFSRWSTTQLILLAAAGQINGSRWHFHVAHHLALCWLLCFASRPRMWGAASISPQPQVGQNWGKIGVSSALGTIRHPYQPSGECSALPLNWTYWRELGMACIASLLPRGMVPW